MLATCPEQATRLAYLVSRYPAVSHTFILREVTQLQEQGFHIEVASINAPDRSAKQMTPDELAAHQTTYYVKSHGWRGAWKAHVWGLLSLAAYWRGLVYAVRLGGWDIRRALFGLLYFTEALMVAKWMDSHRITHLHVHFATAASNVALIVKKMFGVGLSLTVHGPDEFYDTQGQWLQEKVEQSDFLICISHFARSQLMKLSPVSQWSKFEICRLGVDTGRYKPVPRTKTDKAFKVLCVGRLTSAKGQHILIQACKALVARSHAVQLVFIGGGPDEDSLQAKVTENDLQSHVLFTGPLNQIETLDWYAKVDAFALASFAEGIPVVLMEAMASGIPCVSTCVNGIPELIEDGRDGLLVPPSCCEALAAAIERLIASPTLRQELSQHARQRIEAQYNLQQNTMLLARAFQRRLEVRA